MAKKIKNHNLNEIRAQFYKLQTTANKRAEQLEAKGLDSYSRAYQAATSKIGAYRETNFNDLFDVYDTKRYREIKREVARIKNFLNDETSTVEGVEKFIAAEKYKGAFSGGWHKIYGVSYDKSVIDEEKAKKYDYSTPFDELIGLYVNAAIREGTHYFDATQIYKYYKGSGARPDQATIDKIDAFWYS